MDFHFEEAEFSRAAIEQAEKTIVVADHHKVGHPNFIKVCGFDEVEMVVVELEPPVPILDNLGEAGVDVINAGEPAQSASASASPL